MVAEDCLFDLITDDDVEWISHFVGIRADEAVFDMIDFTDKIIQGDSFQFRKQFLYLRIDREPEIAVASKHIFKEAGLALVNTHERAVVGLCVLQRGIDILLKDAMTTLVDGREHGTEWIIRPEVVCYTHIMFGKSECKRMLTFSNGTGFQRKTDVGKQQLLDLFLRIRVIVSFKKTAIRLRRSQDLIEQRH